MNEQKIIVIYAILGLGKPRGLCVIVGLVTKGVVEILKARKELAWLALANLQVSPKLQVKRGRRHQGVSPFYMPWEPGFPIWRRGFPAAPLGIYNARVAFPKRREAFTGWQGVSRPFRKGRKKVCLGSLASPFGSLAFSQRGWGFTVAKWLSHIAAKHLRMAGCFER